MANIKDFGKATLPTGAQANFFSPSSWANLIIGVIMFLIAFAIGQNFTSRIGGVLPIDTTIDPIIKQPAQAQAGKMYL